jgi:hypothetical protein
MTGVTRRTKLDFSASAMGLFKSHSKRRKQTMAKNGNDENKPLSTGDADIDRMIEKMDDVTADRAAGWWAIDEGSWLYGRLRGRYTMAGGQRAYYQLQVLKASPGCNMVVGKGEEAEEVPIEPGMVVNFDERKSVAALAPHAESDGVFNVFIRALEKVKLDNGNTWWRIQIKAQAVKPPSKPIGRGSPESDAEIPF